MCMETPEALALQLMRIPSPTGSEAAVVAWLAARLERHGWLVLLQEAVPGRHNIYAHRGSPEVVFSTHLDTVPPELELSLDHQTLRGRGACDAKGIAAAMIIAAEQLVAAGETRVGLLFLVGEEDGSAGAKAAAELSPRGRFLINGEPTENRLVIGQKGALRAVVRARGRTAHSGYPNLGESAVDHLLDALNAIRHLPLPNDPFLGETTLNIGRIRGGEAVNVIPSWAEADLIWRVVGDTTELRTQVQQAVAGHAEVEFPLEISPLRAENIPGWDATVVSYASDLPLLSAWGVGYQLGPGTIHLAHTDHESIRIAELHEGVDAYCRLAQTLLSLESA